MNTAFFRIQPCRLTQRIPVEDRTETSASIVLRFLRQLHIGVIVTDLLRLCVLFRCIHKKGGKIKRIFFDVFDVRNLFIRTAHLRKIDIVLLDHALHLAHHALIAEPRHIFNRLT